MKLSAIFKIIAIIVKIILRFAIESGVLVISFKIAKNQEK
jgi:hypothetical protein